MIKRILKTFGLILLLLVLVIAGGLTWALGTEKGLQQTLALANKLAPGTLEWEEAGGKLAGRMSIRGLQYSDADVIDARIGSLDFEWQPSALLGLTLSVDQLHLDDIEVHLVEATEQTDTAPSSGELPDISLPVSINLNDIVVSNVAIYPPNVDEPITINRVALSVNAARSDVNLNELEVIAPQGEVRLKGSVSTRDDYPMDLTLAWQTDIDPSKPVQGEGTFVGSLAQLQIEHQVEGFALADVSATVSDIVASPAWDASIGVSIPEPSSLSPLIIGTPQITLQTSGTPDAYKALAKVSVDTIDTGPVTVDADITGSIETLNIASLVARLSENGSELSATGQVTLATLHSELKGQWQALGWPVKGEPQFSSPTGSFDFTGTPEDFTANLRTDVDGDAIPTGQWTVSLDGSTTELTDFAVQGQTLDGVIAVLGTANWEAQPSWDVELSTDGINPGIQWTEFPGSIDLDISSKGQITEDGPQLNADINQLSGSLRDQPLVGGGSVQLVGEKLSIDNLKVGLGQTLLDVDGQVDEQIALDFDVRSPDLQTLLPELAGAISITGSVSGSKDAPLLNARGNASDVAFAENSVTSLTFSVDGGLGENVVSNLTVEASGLSAGAQQISDISVLANGSQLEHRLVLSVATDQGDLATQLDGSFESETWNGVLSLLQLENTQAGNWRLREPTAITANAAQADTSTLCLDNSEKLGNLCVTANWLADGESVVTLNIDALSPRLVSDYLPPDFTLETKLNGDATATLRSDGDVSAQADLAFAPGKLILSAEEAPVEIGLEQTTIDASWQGNEATFELVAALTDLGKVNVQGSIEDPAGAGRLSGVLDADFADLTLISAFAPQVQQVSGALKSNLIVGGTLETPIVEGELALRKFGAEIPEIAMLIEDTELVVNGNPDGTLLITGQSRSGEGQLNIKGNFNPGTRALTLDIDGEQFEVANTAMMQAVISPKLSIGLNDSGMEVTGEVTIPRVYINANGGNEGIKTVSSSSDVVFVSEEGEQAETPPSQITLDVQIILGDNVEVEAGDFRGRLEGDLRIEQTPELAPRGTGTINVVNGDYVIYGQQLDMERGRILFSGGPVDNPSLDMQVARTVQEYEVVAGARIKGTAQTPRLELYSEPSMPDASILSYILLGQPPGTTGGSYTLGKNLTPDLYVSYGIGLFDAINTFNMRYKLTDRLALEAVSGSGSSTDLIYTIEK